MKIRMLMTVRPDFPFHIISPPGTILRVGEIYDAESNKNGAITAICANGEKLGVKPCEFEFESCPKWVYDKWANEWPYSVERATIEQEEPES